MKGVDACVAEVLKRGLDDWIQAAEVASVVAAIQGETTGAGVRGVALAVIAELLNGELMKAGDVTSDGFSAWNMTAAEAVDRIVREWNALSGFPGPGEICWLSNTGEGDRRARSAP